MDKVLLCCIGCEENRYIKEYVDYYKGIGFTNIHIYDNNKGNGEHFEDVLQGDIDDGFVKVINYRDKSICQLEAYQDCYDKNKNDYDWICFFDIDEFLTFKSKSMKVGDYLSDSRFDGYDMIHVNWMLYGDGDELEYNGKSVIETYKKPIMPFNKKIKYNFPENYHIKSILRGGLDDVIWDVTAHSPRIGGKCCDSIGRECSCVDGLAFNVYDFSTMWLRHYTTKSISEFCDKINRGFPDTRPGRREQIDMAERFFRYNKKTEAKIKIVEEKTGIKLGMGEPKNLVFIPLIESWRNQNFLK